MWLIRWGKKFKETHWVLYLLIKKNKQICRVTLVFFSSLRCLFVRLDVQTIFPTISRPLQRTRPRPFRRSAWGRQRVTIKIGRGSCRSRDTTVSGQRKPCRDATGKPVASSGGPTVDMGRRPPSKWNPRPHRRSDYWNENCARHPWPWTCVCCTRLTRRARGERGEKITHRHSTGPTV